MAKVVVDPITRIEGHLRIEVQSDGGMIDEAWASSTLPAFCSFKAFA